jgi:hypothetical protein
MSSSCFLILNKTNEKLSFNDFFREFPMALGSMCEETNDTLDGVLEVSKDFELWPGENYVDSSDDINKGNMIDKNLRSCLHRAGVRRETTKFKWQEIYNEQDF